MLAQVLYDFPIPNLGVVGSNPAGRASSPRPARPAGEHDLLGTPPQRDQLFRAHHIAQQERDVLQGRLVQRLVGRGHAIARHHDVVAEIETLAERRLDADIGRHAGNDRSADAPPAQQIIERRPLNAL